MMKTKLVIFLMLFCSAAFSQDVKEVDLLLVKNTIVTLEKQSILKVLVYPELSRNGQYVIKNKEGEIVKNESYVEDDFLEIIINDLIIGKYTISFTSDYDETEKFEFILK